MGLSILIPVYNRDVTSLVQALARQLSKTGKNGEIVLLDDGSDDVSVSVNRSLQNTPSVSFYQNSKNEGRLAARRKLCDLARNEYLLFLDCDSMLIKDDYLITYFALMEKNIALASGSSVYTDTPPSDCSLMLHWKYGTKRESRKKKSARGKGPGFTSNNFLIKREHFFLLNNPLQLRGYGHEDSWWGILFEQSGIQCYYTPNPVLHDGLEKAERFLDKSENALANLIVLEKNVDTNLLRRHVKIFRWYSRLKGSGLSSVYLFFEKFFHNYFRRNLLSCKPNLFFFDCYRLAVLIKTAKSG